MVTRMPFLSLILIAFFSIDGLAAQDNQSRLYRYKDKNGVTVVKDFLPPEYAQNGYQILNAKFQVLETVAPRKTVQQLEQEKQEAIKVLKMKQQKKDEEEEKKRIARDNIQLLKQFNSLEDVLRTRGSQIGSVDVLINVAKNNVKRQERILANLQSRAAQYERQGNVVPDDIQSQIQQAQKAILLLEKENKQREVKKQDISAQFKQLMLRFNQLSSKKMLQSNAKDTLAHRFPNTKIIKCNSDCATTWSKSVGFVKSISQLPIEAQNTHSLLTAIPNDNKTRGFRLAQVDNSAQKYVVFSVFCQQSTGGNQLCQSKRTKRIVDQYLMHLGR